MDRRLAFSTILILISGGVYLYYGAIGSFVHGAGMHIEEIRYGGEMSSQSVDKVPGFYSFGAILSIILGIDGLNLFYIPVLIVPFTIVNYALFRMLSGNEFISILIVSIYLFSQSQATNTYLSQHGQGRIILSTIILTIILLLVRNGQGTSYILASIISATPLIFISYNFVFRTVLFCLGIVIALAITHSIYDSREYYLEAARKIAYVGLFLIILILGVSNWVYTTFFPRLVAESSGVSGADIFLSAFTGESPDILIPPYLLFTQPESIIYLGVVKYALLAIPGIYVVIYSLVQIYRKRRMNPYLIPLFGICIVGISYFAGRILMGQFSVSFLFLPGVFALSISCRLLPERYKRTLQIIGIAVLLATLISIGIHLYAGSMDRGDNHVVYQENAVDWYIDYNQGTITGDVTSQRIFAAEIMRQEYQQGSRIPPTEYMHNRANILTIDGSVPFLFGFNNSHNVGNYYILDMRTNEVSLYNWVSLRPWSESQHLVDYSNNTNKVYNDNRISIYVDN